jgi:uncharacterized protein YkwD
MSKYVFLGLILTAVMSFSALPHPIEAGKTASAPQESTADELITAVNALRSSKGLLPYQINPILMSLAQQHAEYMASIQMSTVHTDAQGRRPFQRALDAGYLVAGDLSQGGWFSENVTGGQALSADQAVQQWMGDAAHQGTMLSTVLQDVGAGVAVDGIAVYYCLDAALSTGGTPVAYTPPPPQFSPTPTLAVSTPNPDGSVVHIIQPGDTLLAIAIAYGVSLSDLYNLNSINEKTILIPGHKLTIQAAFTPTPTEPTGTPTLLSTVTLWPTASETLTSLPSTPTPPSTPGLTASMAGTVVISIAFAALVIAALITLAGSRKRGK